eukprot:TRINITY_DN10216_c0_g2_i1.p1 TRINITY_DN10216_c0_g2~~TRINITY_DN10216_c0_g2_i1.p1  ORF type:complete len:461 (+),score=116.97 TRINITY_DN10216_c0_g2_i1:114-1496(+)
MTAAQDGESPRPPQAHRERSDSPADQQGSAQAAEASEPERHTALVVTVGLALFADAVLLTIIVPIVPDMLPNESSTKVGILFASKAAVQFILNPFVGHLIDKKLGPQLGLQIGLLILAASTCSFALSNSYWPFLASRAVQGAASGLVVCGGMSLVALKHPPEQRGWAAGNAQAGIAAGVLLGPVIGGALDDVIITHQRPHAMPFVAVAAFIGLDGLAQLLLVCRAPKDHTDGEGEEKQGPSIPTLAKDPQLLVCFVAMFSANCAIALIEPLVPYYLKHQFHYSSRQRGFLWAVAPLAYFFGTPPAGALADKVPKWVLIFVGLLVSGAALPWACAFPSAGAAVTAVCIGCVGFGTSFVETPEQPLICDVVDAKYGRGLYGNCYALNDMAMSLGFIVGPIAGSALKQAFGIKWTLVGTGVYLLAIAPACLCLRRIGSSPDAEKAGLLDAEAPSEEGGIQVAT